MLIPISTDAPLYHYPISTSGLIVVNFLCFIVAGAGHSNDAWMLHYGTFNPLEWLLSIFAHIGIMHLIGNMIFLWAFGLIVEGKLGWRRFLIVYLIIGVGQSGLEQTIMLYRTDSHVLSSVLNVDSKEELIDEILAEDPEYTEAEAEAWVNAFIKEYRGSSCGASSAIFGLLAICMVWAPKNEFQVLFPRRRGLTFEVTIMGYALWYFAWEVVSFVMSDFGAGTAALHLMGAAIGFGVGVLYLKKDWVDCENWDLFRVLSGNYGRFADASTTVGSHADPVLMFGTSDVAVKDSVPDTSHRTKVSKRLAAINDLIDAGDSITASEKMFDLRMQDHKSQLTEKRLKKLSLGLLRADMPDDAEIYLEEYNERFPEDAAWARVRMAQLLLTHHKRPAAALAMLKQVRLSQLNAELQTLAKKVASVAKKLVKSGVEDAEPEW